MPRRPQIDRDVILTTGMAIVDRAGLDAVTMQAVAARLGVTPMALYRHVANKADLLDGLVEKLLGELPAIRAGAAWDAQLVALARALRTIARRHPAVFPLLLLRPAMTSAARARLDGVYAVLRTAGIAPRHLQHVERVISTLALGFAAGEAAGRFPRGADLTFRAMTRFTIAGLAPFRTSS
jgi:AcrR family transcriptional regulator